MKHTHEKLADTEPKLEEDIIVPHRRKVFEGGGLSMKPKAPDSLRPVRPKQARGTTACNGCGVTISANREYCYSCAVTVGVNC